VRWRQDEIGGIAAEDDLAENDNEIAGAEMSDAGFESIMQRASRQELQAAS
jgi:hypothetical protein